MSEPQYRYLTTRVEQGVLVLTVTEPQLHGDSLANALRNELLTAITRSNTPNVVLDLRHVKALSSTAVRPLVSLRRHLAEADGRLMLCGLSSAVETVLRTTRLVSPNRSSGAVFETHPNVQSAVAALAGAAPDPE
jgi:anti-anti-sigma factor